MNIKIIFFLSIFFSTDVNYYSEVPAWNPGAPWKDWYSPLLVCNSFSTCQVWQTHSVNSHHLRRERYVRQWQKRRLYFFIIIRSHSFQGCICKHRGKFTQSCVNTIPTFFYDFDQSCEFYQSFQPPCRPGIHHQTCFMLFIYWLNHHLHTKCRIVCVMYKSRAKLSVFLKTLLQVVDQVRQQKIHPQNDWNATENTGRTNHEDRGFGI